MTSPLWTPSPDRVARANLTRFAGRWHPGGDFAALWRWSVEQPEAFWAAVWEFCGVIAEDRPGTAPWDSVLEGGQRMAPPDPALGPRWFAGARLNFAENLLRHRDQRLAIVSWSELGPGRRLSYAELSAWVARYAAGLRASGVSPGDRVAGLMPNIPETVLAMLATTSLGAIWSSCSPDFGDRAVIDRFGQIRPKVLFAADRYRYAGREVDLIPRIREIAGSLVGLGQVVIVPCGEGGQAEQRTSGPKRGPADQRTGGQQPPIPRGVWVADWLEAGATVRPAVTPPVRFPFDHPVYIVYSSGTTGLPKCIVHGAGGTLIQHLKELVLHTDLGRDDRIFYYTTCGWMMWNWLVSSLAVGATVVLYDGAPFASSPDILWRMAEEERVTVFGTSAKYLARCEKEGISPWRDRNLSALRTILSTGSPLAAHSFDYVYREIKGDVHLASISGGTDLLSCFALGNPTAPVWRGELQCRGLGMAVEVWTPEGRSVTGQAGELVCTRPFPSMPVAFWSDPDAARYREAYFSRWPGVWRHGDWAELTPHEGLIIYGRSDATLNPGGIRIGTAEIYRQVERLPEVEESLVVGQEWEEDVRVILFVRLRQGIALDEGLRQRIREEIRCHASPHHVPKKIIQVPDLPRTLNGKLSELAVKAMIHGRSIGNADALANPEALAFFQNHPELAS